MEDLEQSIEVGQVLAVNMVPTGSELALPQASGSMTIQVADSADFSERPGSIMIGDVIIPYLTRDDETNIISLAEPLVADLEEDTPVYAYPLSYEKQALVEIDNYEDAIWARVPHHLYDRMEDLIRDPDDQEAVTLQFEGNEWVILDILGQEPDVDGSFIDPDTLPMQETGPTSPPADSPTLEVVPFSRSFTVYAIGEVDVWTWLTYEVSRDAGFTDIVQTLETRQTVVTIGPLGPNENYWLRVLAENELGPAVTGHSPVVGPVETITYGPADIPALAEIISNMSTQHIVDPLPVLASNSPSTGSFSWPAFNVKHEGVDLPVAAGDTALRWVTYRWNSGVPTLELADDRPALAPGDMILFVNNSGVGLRVFATDLVTGDLLVDGSIVTRALATDAVTAEVVAARSLTGDLFSGQLVMGSTISTGTQDDNGNIIGARVELGPDGFTIFDSANQEVIQFPLSALSSAKVRAHMEMLSADVQGNFTMHGKNNSIATESELTLAGGVSAPTVPPTVTAVYDTIQLDTTTTAPPHTPNTGFNLGTFALNPSQIRSLAWDPTWSCWVVSQQKSNGIRVWRFNANGSFKMNPGSGRPWHDDFNDKWNVSVTVNTQYADSSMLHSQGTADYFIWGKTPGGAGEINRIPDSWITDFEGRPPALGFDSAANQYMLCQSAGGGNGQVTVRRFTLNNSGASFANATSQGLTTMESGSGTAQRTHGVVYGTQVTNGGAARYAVSGDAYLAVYVFNTSGTMMDNDGSYEMWNKPGVSRGLAHNGTQFASVDATGKITLYENWNWPESSSRAWTGVSAFDSDTAGSQLNPHPGQLAGQHETPMSVPIEFDQMRRAKLRFRVDETNDSGGADDPDKWKIYFVRKATVPVAADFKLVTTLGSPTAPTTHTITANPTGSVPPGGIAGTPGAINNFPGASPGTIESAAGDGLGPYIYLGGDGLARLAKLIQSGTVFITPVANQATSVAVEFDVEFDTIPKVVVSPETSVPGSTVVGWSQLNITTTGFDAIVRRTNTTGTILHWIATTAF